jgi:uncharacterized protein (TIGR03086 family)
VNGTETTDTETTDTETTDTETTDTETTDTETTDTEMSGLLDRAVRVTVDLVAGVPGERWTAATPCAEFDVLALVRHMIGGLRQFTGLAHGDPAGSDGLGGSADEGADAAVAAVDPESAARTYREAARDAVQAWASPAALGRGYDMPWGRLPGRVMVGFLLIEALGHGWDLARATGQDACYDPDLVEAVRVLAREFDGPGMRAPGLFGPAVEAPDAAAPLDRLAAFLGRTPEAEVKCPGR